MVSVTFQERDQFNSFAQLTMSWAGAYLIPTTLNGFLSDSAVFRMELNGGSQLDLSFWEVLTGLFYSYTDLIAFSIFSKGYIQKKVE